MANQAKTHEDCRKTTCFLCMKKGNRELTEFMIGSFLRHVKPDLNFDDERVPRGIWNTCRLLLKNKPLERLQMNCLHFLTFSQYLSSITPEYQPLVLA